MPLADARLRAARAAIAASCLNCLPAPTLGAVQLRDDQRRIVARATRALERQGGCLIGEDVGRGKTFVALALARRWRHPLVIAPASLRSTWRSAAQRAAVPHAFASHESLSRGITPSMPYDGIIVDESHHYRTTSTRRYTALARLAAQTPIVLLSATPLQNRARDLAAQIALFHGERAFSLDVNALAHFVIRGDDASDIGMPAVAAPEWLTLNADDGEVLRAILDLPAPPRLLDGGDAGALRTLGLVRAWASSRAALQTTLRSRRQVATAIAQGLEEGRAPTRREARAWYAAEDVVQLGFPAILMRGAPANCALGELRIALDDDAQSMERLAKILRGAPDPDAARVAAIRLLRASHPASRVIAFSEYASTISALFAAMRGDAGVGMLTAREARIASGRIAREELLARFAPLAQHARPLAAHDSVTLLLATDLLAEGVNLQDASVLVHLDLPWNPARLAQRVGRLRRPGGAREVRAYLLAPPANAASLLDADARLRRKLAEAERVIGAGFQVMPVLAAHAGNDTRDTSGQGAGQSHCSGRQRFTIDDLSASATATGAFLEQLERWRRPASSRPRSSERCIMVAVDAPTTGWLAALNDGRVVSSFGGRIGESLQVARHVAEYAEGRSRPLRPDDARSSLLALRAWLDSEETAATCGIADVPGPLGRAATEWLASFARSLRRHEHAVALPLIARLRDHLRLPLPLGAERLLAEHARRSRHCDGRAMETLNAALRIVDASARYKRAENEQRRPKPVALIVFSPSPD